MASGQGPWIDISVPLYNGMVGWPGDPPIAITRELDIARGHEATVSRLDMSAHTGTHMDAPLHYIAGGASIDQMPIEAVIGRARVVAVSDPECVRVSDLASLGLSRGERILFKTRNSARAWASDTFVEDFVYLSRGAARYLAERQVRAVGVDYLSVGGYLRDGRETHLALLGAGIWVIEGLNLSAVEPGDYELVCLPLRIVGADGAPARAVLRSL